MTAPALGELHNAQDLGSDNDADGDNEEDVPIPPGLDLPVPKVNDTYPSFNALRHAISTWSLRDGFMARCCKKDTTRAQYKCRAAAEGCGWAVRATINRATGLLTITSVSPEHTCSRTGGWVNHEGIEQPGRRAVHATQRWVVEMLERLSFRPQVTTDAREIVALIQERLGTTITEKLAYKARDRMLSANGIQPPLPHGRGGRPDQVLQRKRQREVEAAMVQQRAEERLSRAQESPEQVAHIEANRPGLSDEARADESGYTRPDSREFVFQSGFRILGPANGPSTRQPGPFIRSEAALPPQEPSPGVLPTLPAPAAPAAPPAQMMQACHACGGSGVAPVPSSDSSFAAAPSSGQAGGPTTPQPRDEELALLRQQLALLAKQMDLLAKRRRTGG